MDANLKVTEVSAGRGAAWLAEGFGFFRKAPMAWIGLSAGWLIITVNRDAPRGDNQRDWEGDRRTPPRANGEGPAIAP